MTSHRASIVRRLERADRAHQREVGGGWGLRNLKWVLGLLLGGFALDVGLHLDAGWRVTLLALFLLGAAVWLGWSWFLANVRRNPLEHIARLLEERDPSLGSSLINILQLQAQTVDGSLAPLTRDLARQAIDGYGAELAPVPFESLARTGALRRESKRAGFALAAFALVLVGLFPITLVEVARFVDPYGDHPPYSFTQLAVVDPGQAGTNVLYGRALVVTVKSTGHRPKEVFLTAYPAGQPAQALTVPMFDKGKLGYQQQIDQIRADMIVYAHTKDGHSRSKLVRVGVILVPQLDQAFVQVAPPAYTGLAPAEQPYAFKAVQALAGSEVRFRLQSNRPLREGTVEVVAGEAPPQRITLTKSGTNEVAGGFVARDSGRLRFALVDAQGIPSQDDWEGALTVTQDLPPEITLAEPPRSAFVALDFRVPVRIEASDDYGLKQVRIHRALNGVYTAPKVVQPTNIVTRTTETMELNLPELGVKPGDVLSFFAEALDTAPEPHLARTETVHLAVISVEEYNNYLRERLDLTLIKMKYEEVLGRLHDLVEEQKKLGEAARRAREQLAKADARQREALQRELDALLARQNELNQQLDKLAGQMDQLVRENPVYDVEKELQEQLHELAATIRESTAANAEVSRQISQRSAPPDQPRQLSPGMLADFEAASDEQRRRLGGVEDKGRQQVAGTLQDLAEMQELLKDFNRFEALFRIQESLTEHARPYNRAGQLSREDQLVLRDLAATEKQMGDALGQLENKLRQDADAAAQRFPKAARSARALADKIEEVRLQHLARVAMEQMLAANGERSYRSADRLREEMAKLFSECNSEGSCPNGDEVDQYLRLVRSLKPGNTFAQMKRSRNFSLPGPRGGFGLQGEGDGLSGESGYAAGSQQALDVLGNESFLSRSAQSDLASKAGLGTGRPGDAAHGLALDKTETLTGLNPVNRQSGAVRSESGMDEYNEVVDRYFKAITK